MDALSGIEEFLADLKGTLADGSFVKLSLQGYSGPERDLKSIDVRKILVKREEKLSFTSHFKTRDIVKNYTVDEAIGRIHEGLGNGFARANLLTTGFDLMLAKSGKGWRMKRSAPTRLEAPSLAHDRQKKRLIGASGKPYLRALKLTDEQGNVLQSAQDKYRQINRYIEILSTLLEAIPPERLRRIVDMGSGKGYLTFALYDHLAGNLQRDVEVTGVEFRPDLVKLCNQIATQSGFSGLHFVEGSIENFDSTGTDVLIALHACDTATDDAIRKGIDAGAELIVVAPCCHKQIRRQIEAHKASNDLDFLLKHGIFTERQAEMVTDGMRAMILEYCGYSTKVFEFISDAHTPKNVLIVATRNPRARLHDPAIREKLAKAKHYFGIEYHHLERALGI